MGPRLVLLAAAAVALTACAERGTGERPVAPPVVDACTLADGALDDAAFVIATVPLAGTRVDSGFAVAGCSRTFESTVVWRLIARDGSLLNSGFAMGGGVDGPGPFAFTVTYTAAERQIGHLEVFEEDVSDGEGFPPGRTVLPLVLQP